MHLWSFPQTWNHFPCQHWGRLAVKLMRFVKVTKFPIVLFFRRGHRMPSINLHRDNWILASAYLNGLAALLCAADTDACVKLSRRNAPSRSPSGSCPLGGSRILDARPIGSRTCLQILCPRVCGRWPRFCSFRTWMTSLLNGNQGMKCKCLHTKKISVFWLKIKYFYLECHFVEDGDLIALVDRDLTVEFFDLYVFRITESVQLIGFTCIGLVLGLL